MVDFKKMAQGRKAFERKDAPKNATTKKPKKNLEQSSADEVDEVAQAFRDRLTKEDKRKKLATDSEFWVALCFIDRADKERFLRKYGLNSLGDKYLSGCDVERVLDRRINPATDGHRKER